jgi:hypothetical protein
LASALLIIIQLVSLKIPRWFIWTTLSSFIFLTGLRIYYYNQIDLEYYGKGSNLVFSVANEFYNPLPVGRIILFFLLLLGTGIILYYYGNFKKKSNKDNIYYKQLSWWIVSFIAPFLMLIFFGMLSILKIWNDFLSAYLFSFFSFTIILSILFRPKFLNTGQAGLGRIKSFPSVVQWNFF